MREAWENPRYESADFARGYSEAKQEEFHRVTDIAMEREAKLINEMVEWQNIAEYLANELATKVTDIPGVTPKSIIDGARFAVKQVAQVMTEHLEMTPDLAQRFLYALPYIANAVEDYWRNDDKEDELRDLLLEIRAVAIICTKE